MWTTRKFKEIDPPPPTLSTHTHHHHLPHSRAPQKKHKLFQTSVFPQKIFGTKPVCVFFLMKNTGSTNLLCAFPGGQLKPVCITPDRKGLCFCLCAPHHNAPQHQHQHPHQHQHQHHLFLRSFAHSSAVTKKNTGTSFRTLAQKLPSQTNWIKHVDETFHTVKPYSQDRHAMRLKRTRINMMFAVVMCSHELYFSETVFGFHWSAIQSRLRY